MRVGGGGGGKGSSAAIGWVGALVNLISTTPAVTIRRTMAAGAVSIRPRGMTAAPERES